jgi:hemolysin activation/secretion protein
LGGNKVLRGFDEQSIWGNFYSISGVEARMLLSTNSYLFVFGELAWVRNPYEQDFEINQPMSFGAGLNFETNAGIFGISLAIGKEKDNPFDFRNAKTHFGFVSLF